MKKISNLSVCARLIKLVKPLSGYMVLAVVLGLAGHLCAAFIPIVGAVKALSILKVISVKTILPTALVLLLFALLRGVLHYGEQACNHYIAFKLLALLRDKIFGVLRKLCPAKLEGRDKGQLIALITSDIERLEVFYAHTISPVLIALGMTGIMCIFIGSYHWALGLLALAAYAAVGVMVPLTTSKLSGTDGDSLAAKNGDMGTFVLDSLRGLPEIQQYGRGHSRIEQMEELSGSMSSDEKRLKLRAGRSRAVSGALIWVFDISMLTLSIYFHKNGLVGFEGVIIPTVALMSSFGPVIALADLGSTLQGTFASGRRVLELLDEQPETAELTGKEKASFGNVKAEDISFSYGEEKVLKDFSLDLPGQSVIGIAGRSGSGKSTFLKLLMRFFEPDSGRIAISDRDLDSINTSDLRSMQSYVTQETQLFHDSIAENIKISKADASAEEIEAACRKASVHDFIMSLPKGYDTEVGELGSTLSGGEKQRLGLARAFLHDAPLLLLDEPTSNLDSLNEAVILKSIDAERKGRTVVLVSHRESALRIADRCVEVERGGVS